MISILAEASLRALVIALASGALIWACRLRHPAARSAIWSAVMLTMLACPLWVAWSPIEWKIPIPRSPFSTPAVPTPSPSYAPPASLPIAAPPQAPARFPSPSPVSAPSLQWHLDPASLLTTVWAIGMLIGLARLTIGTLHIRRLLSSASPGANGERLHASVSAPVTAGGLRPVILLPLASTEWPEEMKRAVLLHERAHVRRRDPLILWLAELNRALFWFHPLAWWLTRVMSETAEQACDAEVLSSGMEPRQYAAWLIELAQMVNLSAGRIRVSGASATSGLAARITRLVQQNPIPQPERRMKVALASGLFAVTAAFSLACRPSPTQERLPGQPTMNELMHRSAKRREQEMQRFTDARERVRRMSPADAEAAVAQLKRHPEDGALVNQVVGYYKLHSDTGGLIKLSLWYIEHHPTGNVAPWTIDPAWDQKAWQQGAALWKQNLKRPDANAATYAAAAQYFEGGSKPTAEQILLEAAHKFPTENWTPAFADLYAMTLLGAVGPRSDGNIVRQVSAKEAEGAFAKEVLSKLERSTDVPLLTLTALRTIPWWQPGVSLEATEALLKRAAEVAPENRGVQSATIALNQFKREISMRTTPMPQLSESQQMERLTYNVWFGGNRKIEGQTREERANRLLDLASRHKDDPLYSDAVFAARQTLALEALKHGDRKSAVKLLFASIEGPVTQQMRVRAIDMTASRELVDWGERAQVADFLDRCATFNYRRAQLTAWAKEIRRGVNPELIPYHSD